MLNGNNSTYLLLVWPQNNGFPARGGNLSLNKAECLSMEHSGHSGQRLIEWVKSYILIELVHKLIEGDLDLIEWDIDQLSEIILIQYNLDWLREIYLIEGDLDWKIEIKDTFYEIWDPDWVRSKNNWVGSDL